MKTKTMQGPLPDLLKAAIKTIYKAEFRSCPEVARELNAAIAKAEKYLAKSQVAEVA